MFTTSALNVERSRDLAGGLYQLGQISIDYPLIFGSPPYAFSWTVQVPATDFMICIGRNKGGKEIHESAVIRNTNAYVTSEVDPITVGVWVRLKFRLEGNAWNYVDKYIEASKVIGLPSQNGRWNDAGRWDDTLNWVD